MIILFSFIFFSNIYSTFPKVILLEFPNSKQDHLLAAAINFVLIVSVHSPLSHRLFLPFYKNGLNFPF